MKSEKIRRDIQSPHRRSGLDGPKLGRVARVRDPQGPRPMGWTRRRGNHGTTNPNGAASKSGMSLFWSVALGVMALVVIMGFILFWMRSHRRVAAGVEVARNPENVRVSSRFASPSEDEALALVRRALAVRDPALVDDCLLHGESTPGEVVAFMAGLEDREGRIERTAWLSSMDVDGMLIDGVLVVCKGRTTPIERLALLVPDDHGVWKMDFDGFARTSKPPWKDFLEHRADRARVRVLAKEDSYYNGIFLDETQWTCYGLVSTEATEWLPDGEVVLRGYCRKGTPQARAMKRISEDGAKIRRVTLELVRTKDAGPRQFEITRILSEEWIVPPEPFDTKFN